jgi:hypothetical protein
MEAQNTQNTPPEIPTTATASLIHSTKSTLRLLLTSNGLSDPSLEKAFLEMTNYRTDLKIAWIGTAGDPIEWVPDEAHKESCVAKLIPEKLAQQEE